MTTDLRRLRRCFSQATDNHPPLSERFYEIFFERHPRVKKLFSRVAPAEQQAKLNQMLTVLIDHLAVVEELDDDRFLAETLRSLGAQHVGYGVTPEMLPWFGDCLRDALKETSGEEWSDACSKAWDQAFAEIGRLMLEGMGA
jgi:hemoglobin-like flavoprotein